MPQLSVVVPVHNEEDNVAPLVDEILRALRGRIDFEIVYVDDASRDGTLARLRQLQAPPEPVAAPAVVEAPVATPVAASIAAPIAAPIKILATASWAVSG